MTLDERPKAVSIDASDPLRPRVTIDGHDVTHDLTGVSLQVVAREVPQVVLRVSGRAGASFDGFARVAVEVPADPGPAAEVFLAAIDPGELQNAALNRVDLGSGPTATTEAILAQLCEWARGD